MATYNDFVAAIDNLLRLTVARQTLQLNSTTREKAFEVYVLCLVVEAVRRAGGTYTIVGINSGNNPSPVVFRAAPGSVFSRTQDFAYIECRLNGKHFELHVDVEFEGSSGATHEMDISIVEHAHADRSRQGRRNPRYSIYITECKFFSSSTPSIGLARALVGLTSDFHTKMGCAFVSNGATDNLKNYLSNKSRPDPFIDLTPLNTATEERFINSVEMKLRKWASV
jgi:hypothetical protein